LDDYHTVKDFVESGLFQKEKSSGITVYVCLEQVEKEELYDEVKAASKIKKEPRAIAKPRVKTEPRTKVKKEPRVKKEAQEEELPSDDVYRKRGLSQVSSVQEERSPKEDSFKSPYELRSKH
jgi:hypothetical protein